jgi:hypothetical protein
MGVVFLSALTYLLVRLGVVTQTGKNFMLDALFRNTLGAADVTHVGLFDFDNGRNITGETVDDNIDDVATPYANNDIIIFTAKTGGSNIVLLKPYYVINKAANLFQISEVQGGAAVDFGSDLTATTTIRRLTEISGGSPAYAPRSARSTTPRRRSSTSRREPWWTGLASTTSWPSAARCRRSTT